MRSDKGTTSSNWSEMRSSVAGNDYGVDLDLKGRSARAMLFFGTAAGPSMSRRATASWREVRGSRSSSAGWATTSSRAVRADVFVIRARFGVDTVAEDRVLNERGVNDLGVDSSYDFRIWFEGTTAVVP